MPPWHAAPAHHGEFTSERTLTQEEIDTIVAWVENGTLRGKRSDAPPPLEWDNTTEWSIGKPDLILTLPENYFVGDDVEDIYVDFYTVVTEEMLPEPRYIKAIEFKPGSSVVHHIISDPLGGIGHPGARQTKIRCHSDSDHPARPLALSSRVASPAACRLPESSLHRQRGYAVARAGPHLRR